MPDVPKKLEEGSTTTTSKAATNIPMAKGAPFTGQTGEQYLKLGRGVDINNLHAGVKTLLFGMAEEYGSLTGKSIQVDSGYRSYDKQAALHRQDPNKAAPPGRSLHEFGLAVDINKVDANELEKLGLMKKYGFTRPIGGEPWHIEPAGVQKNVKKAINDPGTKDSLVEASMFRGGGGAGTDPSAKWYRRNHELAMSLLNSPGVPVKEKIAESKDKDNQINAVSMPDGKAVGVTGGAATTQAANEAKKENNVIQGNFPQAKKPDVSPQATQTKDNSTAQNITTPWQNDPANTDKEPDTSGTNSDIKETIVENTKKAGGDPNLMLAFAAVESGLNPQAKAGSSSASGLFQFTKATWDEQLGKHGSKYGLSPNATPFDPKASTLLATEYVKSNLKAINPVKPNPTVTDAYLTHFLGPGGAKTFLSQTPDTDASSALPKAAASNKGIFEFKGPDTTIGEVYNELNKRVTEKGRAAGASITTSPLPGTQKTATSGTGEDLLQGGSASTTSAPEKKTETSSLINTEAKREMISSSSNSGVFVDKRGSSTIARERRDTGESFAGPNMTNIESSLDKSLGIQKDQLDVLKGILENVSPEKLGKILAEAVQAASKNASNQETMKEKDDRNMGRKDLAPRSSVDFSRKVM